MPKEETLAGERIRKTEVTGKFCQTLATEISAGEWNGIMEEEGRTPYTRPRGGEGKGITTTPTEGGGK